MFWAASETENMLIGGGFRALKEATGHNPQEELIKQWLGDESVRQEIINRIKAHFGKLHEKGAVDPFLKAAHDGIAVGLLEFSEFWGKVNRFVASPAIRAFNLIAKHFNKDEMEKADGKISAKRNSILGTCSPQDQDDIDAIWNSENELRKQVLPRAAQIAADLGDGRFEIDFLRKVYLERLKELKGTRNKPGSLVHTNKEMVDMLKFFIARYEFPKHEDLRLISEMTTLIAAQLNGFYEVYQSPKSKSIDFTIIKGLAETLDGVKKKFAADYGQAAGEKLYRAVLYRLDASFEDNPDMKNFGDNLKRQLEMHTGKNAAVRGMLTGDLIDRLEEVVEILKTDRMEERVVKQNGGIRQDGKYIDELRVEQLSSAASRSR